MNIARTIAALMLGAASLTACDLPGSAGSLSDCATTQSECINAWFDEKFEEQLKFSPISQTSLGRKTDYDKIDDFSNEAQDEQLEWLRAATREMEANFDYDALSDDAKLSWDMWQFRLNEAEEDAKWRRQEYVLHQMNGTHTGLPTFLLNQHKVDSEGDMVAFIARLGGIGTAIGQLLERAKANAEFGTRPPRFAYDAVIGESRKLITGAPFDDEGEPSALWQTSEDHLANLVANGKITENRAAELREDARSALTQKFKPAYERLADWFENDRANAAGNARGANSLTDGEAYYNHRIAAMTTTSLTADEVHQIGLDEVGRIRGEMEAIMRKVGFEGTLQDFFTFTRTDDRFFFPDTDAGREQYLEAARGHLDFINSRLPDYFGTLPKAPLEVRRVESFREQDGGAQHYQPGTPDGSRAGIFYAHLSDMKAMPIPALESVTYHEGNPGHHMQVSIARELQDMPKFRSQGGNISAFGEGWGLYAEFLAKEMGGYQDPYSDFGRLSNEMWRAIRLVVDTGIHSKGWSEQEAVDYFLANSPIPETTARSEVRRYIVWPGQATAYKIGMIRIQELRGKAQRELREKFDIRGFHDTVLGGGAVPLDILEKRVDQWIAKVKAA